jgi:hypothetical protein
MFTEETKGTSSASDANPSPMSAFRSMAEPLAQERDPVLPGAS